MTSNPVRHISEQLAIRCTQALPYNTDMMLAALGRHADKTLQGTSRGVLGDVTPIVLKPIRRLLSCV